MEAGGIGGNFDNPRGGSGPDRGEPRETVNKGSATKDERREEAKRYRNPGRLKRLAVGASAVGAVGLAALGIVHATDSGSGHSQGADKGYSRVIDTKQEIAHGIGYDSDIQALGLDAGTRYVVDAGQLKLSY